MLEHCPILSKDLVTVTSVLQHLDKARQHWILLDITRIASCFTLVVSAPSQSTGLKSDETRPNQKL